MAAVKTMRVAKVFLKSSQTYFKLQTRNNGSSRKARKGRQVRDRLSGFFLLWAALAQ